MSDLEQMSMIHNRRDLAFRWVGREDSETKSKNAYRHTPSYPVPSQVILDLANLKNIKNWIITFLKGALKFSLRY